MKTGNTKTSKQVTLHTEVVAVEQEAETSKKREREKERETGPSASSGGQLNAPLKVARRFKLGVSADG